MDSCRARWYSTSLILIALGLTHTGAPHYLDRDDVYNGYLIPGGSIVIVNLWLVLFCLRSI
jgi:hypothetical protein